MDQSRGLEKDILGSKKRAARLKTFSLLVSLFVLALESVPGSNKCRSCWDFMGVRVCWSEVLVLICFQGLVPAKKRSLHSALMVPLFCLHPRRVLQEEPFQCFVWFCKRQPPHSAFRVLPKQRSNPVLRANSNVLELQFFAAFHNLCIC